MANTKYWYKHLLIAPFVLLGIIGCQSTIKHNDSQIVAAVAPIDAHTALLWIQSNSEQAISVSIAGSASRTVYPVPSQDFTAKVPFNNLAPGSTVQYRIQQGQRVLNGQFKVIPEPNSDEPVRIAWSGDLAGQNVCRDAHRGFPALAPIVQGGYDVFVGLGDMIYADSQCEDEGRYGNNQIGAAFAPSVSIDDFRAHWRYTREDRHLQQLLANTLYVPVWDDHEVVNDFGPTRADLDGMPVFDPGLKAFIEQNPIPELRETARLYAEYALGQHAHMFVLDTRSYRDSNLAKDNDQKSLLGRQQLQWLLANLEQSDATWNVIVSSVPISVPTGWPKENGRDGWASGDQNTGFESELRQIFQTAHTHNKRLVFITTDVHFAQGVRLQPFVDAPEFLVYEFMTGPLSAGLFPSRELDPSFSPERLFFYGPESIDAVKTYTEALRWFNFGVLQFDDDGQLSMQLFDGLGQLQHTQTIEAAAQ